MQRVTSILANYSLRNARACTKARPSLFRQLCTAAEARSYKLRLDLPAKGETVEFIFKQRRQVSRVIDIDPIAGRIFVEATPDFTRGPILIGGQSLSCNYGKIDITPQQISDLAKKEADSLKSLAPQLYEQMKSKTTFTLEDAFNFIAPRMKPQRNLTAADQRAIALYTTQLLIARYWTLFGARGHGVYYCYSLERVKVLQLQQRALFDRQLTDRFVAMTRPLVTALLVPLMPQVGSDGKKIAPVANETAAPLPERDPSAAELTLAAAIKPMTTEQIAVARNQVTNDRAVKPLIDLLQRVACNTETHELMDGLVYLRLLRPLGLKAFPNDVAALLTVIGVWNEHTCPPELRVTLEDLAQHGPLLVPPKEVTRVTPVTPSAGNEHVPQHVNISSAADIAAGRVSFMDQRSYAIDDDSTTEVDDAVSIERIKGRDGDPLDIGDLWVHIHISSPASFDHVAPNNPADLAARRRASTIYLPHRRYAMFPQSLVQLFTLTPNQPNTALTFSARLDPVTGALVDYRVQPSLVNITRVNYYHVEQVLNKSTVSDVQSRDLAELYHVAQLRRKYRSDIGARLINLPDPDVKVSREGDRAEIKLLPNTTPKSRVLVEELMVLAGELAAKMAIERQLPVPLRVQVKPELPEHIARDPFVTAGDNVPPLARLVREMRVLPYSSTASTTAGSDVGHYSVGLETYARVTSPIRRYSDLIFQYQYYAQLQGKELPFSADLLQQMLIQVDATSYYIHQLQQRCERYWKYKYLAQHTTHCYYGVVIDVHTPPSTWAEFVDTTADPWTLQPRMGVYVPAIGLMVHVQLGEVNIALKATDVVILRPSTNYSQQTFFAFEALVTEHIPTLEEMSVPITTRSVPDVQQ